MHNLRVEIHGIYAGPVKPLPTASGIVRTAIDKSPAALPLEIRSTGLLGDEQGNPRFHGGPDKAICCFPLEHYAPLAALARVELPTPAFGENFSTHGALEEDICLGDIFSIAGLLLQVTQPRGPCATLRKRYNSTALPRLMTKSGRTGWYLRVLRSGVLTEGPLVLTERPHAGWTIARLNRLAYGKVTDAHSIQQVINFAELSEAWRKDLERRLLA